MTEKIFLLLSLGSIPLTAPCLLLIYRKVNNNDGKFYISLFRLIKKKCLGTVFNVHSLTMLIFTGK